MITLIKLSENDKRLIIALLLVLILVFVLIGVIGMLVQRVMRWQGKRMDTLVHDVVVTKVITNKKQLKKYGKKKSWALFFKQSYIPLILIMVAFLSLLITCMVRKDVSYNIFDHKKTGFSTLLFLWDFDNAIYVKVFGITVLSEWPPLLNTPHFEVDAIGSYIFVPLFLVGVIWYLVAVQSYISRRIRLFKLCSTIFEKSLEGYTQAHGFNTNPTIQTPNNPPATNPDGQQQ